MTDCPPGFVEFLRAAKAATYAAQGDDASVTPALRPVYAFLRRALVAPSAELPVRGPREFTVETMHYACNWQGSLHWFEGSESIVQEGRAVFALRFSGGMLA